MISSISNVRLVLESLQIKNNLLFTRVKAYLLTEGVKKLIGQSKQLVNKRLIFQKSIQEDCITLSFNEKTGKYSHCSVTILLEFETEGHFLKLGESIVNLDNIANFQKNGQTLAYQVNKCYDRNAKIWLSVFLSSHDTNSKKKLDSPKKSEDRHSHSVHQLPNRLRGWLEVNPLNFTEQSALDNEDNQEEYSIISDAKTSFDFRKNRQRQSAQKTQIHQKIYQKSQQITQLQQKLSQVNTELRLVKQQMAAVETKYCEVVSVSQLLEDKLKQSQSDTTKFANQFYELKTKVSYLEKSLESQRELSSSQNQKYIKLYQQSELVRNKLSFEVQSIKNKQKEHFRQSQLKVTQEQIRSKSIERNEQSLRDKIQLYITQIATIKQAYEMEKKLKIKQKEQINVLTERIKNVNGEKEKLETDNINLKNKSMELQNELQLCRFSLKQIQQELSEARTSNDKYRELISSYQSEVYALNDTLKAEHNTYNQNLQQIQLKSQQEQKNMEVYIQELETKSVYEHQKVNQLSLLKKQMTKIKQSLASQKQNNQDLQTQNSNLKATKLSLEKKIAQQQVRVIELTKQKAIIEIQLKVVQEELISGSQNKNQQGLALEEKERFAVQCYSQRDLFWQKQIEKLEADTLALIQKWKKEKDHLTKKGQQAEIELKKKCESIQQLQSKVKQCQDNLNKLKKSYKQAESNVKNLKQSLQQGNEQIGKKVLKIQSLQKKIISLEDVEAALNESENRLAIKNKQIVAAKSEFEREKGNRIKQKVEIKQIIVVISNVLGKSEKHKVFYDQIRSQTIDGQLLSLLNSSIKQYCQKHNRIKQRLQTLQDMKRELELKEKKDAKINKSFVVERRLSHNSSRKIDLEEDLSYPNNKLTFPHPKFINWSTNEDPSTVNKILKQQNEEIKIKLQKFTFRVNQLEKTIENLNQSLDKLKIENKRLSQEIDVKTDELNQNLRISKNKQNQLNTVREQLKEKGVELAQVNSKLDELSRMLQIQKTKKASSLPKSSHSKASDDSFFKILELQKKLKSHQQQIDRFKRQKQERKRDEGPYLKQVKSLELKLRQKQAIISSMKKQYEQQRTKSDQQRQVQILRQKKLKQEHEEELQFHMKLERQLKQKLTEQEDKLRQLQKKIKVLEDNARNSNLQTKTAAEREQKAKKIINAEWELKLRSVQSDHQNELSILQRLLEQQRSIQRSFKDLLQQKQYEIEKKQLKIQDLMAEQEAYGTKIRNLEEGEGQYKETIEELEKQIQTESMKGSHKNIEKEGSSCEEKKSNYSIKTFTFR